MNDSAKGRRIIIEIIYDQAPQKYGTRPGSNSRPLDLQSDLDLLPDTLPTALRPQLSVTSEELVNGFFKLAQEKCC